MIDPYVLLAPIYFLGVIALLGFLGCAEIIGVEEWEPGGETEPNLDSPPGSPKNLVAVAGDAEVQLTWDAISGVTEYHVLRSEASGTVAADYPDQTIVQADWLPWTDKDLVNGTTYFYRVTAVNSVGESDLSNEASATPSWPFGAFVIGVSTGANRPGEDGFFGMKIQIGAVQLKIQTLGRYVDPQFTGPHEVVLIDGATELELGHALVDLNSPKDDLGFRYAPLVPADVNVQEVTLEADATYYIVSQEFTLGDEFYDQDTTVVTRTEAQVISAIYSNSPSSPPGSWQPVGGAGQTYGPVSFQY